MIDTRSRHYIGAFYIKVRITSEISLPCLCICKGYTPGSEKNKTISPNSHLSLTHFQRSDYSIPSARSVDVNWRDINPGRERTRQAHRRRKRPYTTKTRKATKAHWRRNCLITFFYFIYIFFFPTFFLSFLPPPFSLLLRFLFQPTHTLLYRLYQGCVGCMIFGWSEFGVYVCPVYR